MSPQLTKWLLVLALGSCAFACTSDAPSSDSKAAPVYLVSVDFVDASRAELVPHRLPENTVQELLAKGFEQLGLKSAPVVDPDEPWARYRMDLRRAGLPVWPDYWSVRAHVWLMYGLNSKTGLSSSVVPGELKVVWAAELKIRPPGDDLDLHAQLDASATVSFGGEKDAFPSFLAAQAEKVHAQLMTRIGRRISVLTQSEDELGRSLLSKESQTRLAVVERLSITHTPHMGALLVKQLTRETDALVRLRIIGALAERKEKSAVEPLIALVDPRDRELLRAILDALVAIGGNRVDDFLDILSSHDAADIRLMVEYARQRLGASRKGNQNVPAKRNTP